jgi:hypothetical protein
MRPANRLSTDAVREPTEALERDAATAITAFARLPMGATLRTNRLHQRELGDNITSYAFKAPWDESGTA